MNYYGTQVTNLIEELRRLPGIGSKSAQRLAFHIINMPEEHVEHLAEVLVSAKKIFVTVNAAVHSQTGKSARSVPATNGITAP